MNPTFRTVDLLLRLEWAAVLLAAIAVYVFCRRLVAALRPADPGARPGDARLSCRPGVGAVVYNAFHILVWPAILFVAGLYTDSALTMQVAAIWTAHIAMDRALGYGLKLPTGFTDTHLGRIGKGS